VVQELFQEFAFSGVDSASIISATRLRGLIGAVENEYELDVECQEVAYSPEHGFLYWIRGRYFCASY
jgi:hypothetical protein